VEVLDARTGTVTLWANPDGSFTREESLAPTRVRRDGKWVPQDLRLVDRDGALAPEAAPVDVKISKGGRSLATITEGPAAVELGWLATLPAPRLRDGVATYPLNQDADLTVAATATGLEYSLILHTAAPRSSRCSGCR
jgi:hypothetical protein